MRNVIAIAKRELLSLFVSPVAYIVLGAFGVLSAYFFYLILFYYNVYVVQAAQMPWAGSQVPSINQFVIEQYFRTLLVVLVFLIPILTMRTIAEERRRGTFELLITSPVSVLEIVLGKFLGTGVLVVAMILLAAVYPLFLPFVADPELAPLFSGIGGVILFALGLSAVGIAASSYTENQIVAAASSMMVLLLLYVIQAPAEESGNTFVYEFLRFISPNAQVDGFIKGVISLKSGFYFVSLITLGIFLSVRALESHRYR